MATIARLAMLRARHVDQRIKDTVCDNSI